MNKTLQKYFPNGFLIGDFGDRHKYYTIKGANVYGIQLTPEEYDSLISGTSEYLRGYAEGFEEGCEMSDNLGIEEFWKELRGTIKENGGTIAPEEDSTNYEYWLKRYINNYNQALKDNLDQIFGTKPYKIINTVRFPMREYITTILPDNDGETEGENDTLALIVGTIAVLLGGWVGLSLARIIFGS